MAIILPAGILQFPSVRTVELSEHLKANSDTDMSANALGQFSVFRVRRIIFESESSRFAIF